MGQDKDPYKLISASKMISKYQLLWEAAQICTNNRLLIPFMIVGIRVLAWQSNAVTWLALQCVICSCSKCCSLCPQLLWNLQLFPSASRHTSSHIKFHIVSPMGACLSCDNDESYEAAGVSMKSHLRIANPAETYKKPYKTATMFSLSGSNEQNSLGTKFDSRFH